MKIVKEREFDDGCRRVTVDLEPGMELIAVSKDRMYKLGMPCDDQIMPGEVLTEAQETCWCAVEQKWV